MNDALQQIMFRVLPQEHFDWYRCMWADLVDRHFTFSVSSCQAAANGLAETKMLTFSVTVAVDT